MDSSTYRRGIVLALGVLCLAFAAAPASAAEFPYKLEPVLSLTGDCSTSGLDEVPDPDCDEGSYPPPPDRPSARFNEPRSVAIDAYGNEYVASYGGLDASDGRIDIFDDDGSFITELADPFGPKSLTVDSEGNLYVFEQAGGSNAEIARYTPTVYNPEDGEIAYGNPRVVIDSSASTGLGGVAVDLTNDRLYASWWGNYITEYEAAKDGNDLLTTIELPPGFIYNNWVAVDGQRDRLYASACRTISDCGVLVLEADAPHGLLEEIDGSEVPLGDFLSASGRLALAVDESNGHLLVGDLAATENIYEFDADYEYLSRTRLPSPQGNALQIAVSNSPLNPAARNFRYLFAPLTAASGSVLAFEPPAVSPPAIESLAVANIGETEAELRARIDPGTDPDAEPAEYRIEYVSEAQHEASGFDEATVVTSGTIPSPGAARSVSAFVKNLSPGEDYRFRVVASNGVGEDEAEGAFATHADAPLTTACPNASLRGGISGLLPDCRAYELVTPPDTNGNPTKGSYIEGDRFAAPQSSPSGTAVNFMLLGGTLPGAAGTGGIYGDPYKATRSAGGWGTQLVGPNGAQTSKPRPGSFSPDQGFNFWLAAGEGSALVGGLETHYVRYPDGHSELVARGSEGTDPRAAGKLITEGGTHIVFQTGATESTPKKLEPNAPPDGTTAVYDRTRDPITGAEQTHVVSLLPGDETPEAGENATYLSASADGNGIAFEIGSTLYLRLGNQTTYEIGTGVELAGVAEGGARIFYVEGGDLWAFESDSQDRIRFTDTGDAVPVNVAPQGTRAYFISETVIPGSGENPNEAAPQPGGQNLYLSEEGDISFVGTVTDRDVEGVPSASGQRDGLGLWTEVLLSQRLGFDPSRVTPGGRVMLFQSRANLDGYEPGGNPQVYRYDSAAGELECISCPPTKAAPGKGGTLQSFLLENDAAPFGPHGFVPALRADGKRAFFESSEALVSGDTDKRRDVYEWEAQGVGSCTRSSGCVYLISSGHSETDDYLFGHSQSGDDVFFTTNDVLVRGDQTTLSVYDAKVGGGFGAGAAAPCPQIDLCRAPVTPGPALPPPTSESLGRLQEAATPKTCPKGKRKVKRRGKAGKAGKVRCVKKKKNRKHKKHRRAGAKKKGGQR